MLTPNRPSALNRREFTVLGLSALGTTALGFWAASTTSSTAASLPHRPPGAGRLWRGGNTDPGAAERRFLEQCIRCGQCAAPCPEQAIAGRVEKAIRFHGVEAGAQAGTPFIAPRLAPCLMCVDLPCVRACPTGALDPELTDIAEARMGVAVIVDREGCLALQGLRCEVCYARCPARGTAITLERRVNPRTGVHAVFEPVVHKEACTGCGVCEQACPREEAVIKVGRLVPSRRDSDRFYQFKEPRPL
jgi:ferredoxin-type protein NapG